MSKSDLEMEHLTRLRKELHRFPEISGAEKETAQYITQKLDELRPDRLETGVGSEGVMALFKSPAGSAERTLIFRAELDAIAVDEENGFAHRSKNSGVMHGCGHDGHMAILMGLAEELSEERVEDADIWVVFQPAEETGEGALRIMTDDRFTQIDADHAFALHNLPGYEENSVIVRDGVFAAASVGLEVTFTGQSSHAAYPEQGVNPSAAIAELIRSAESKLKPFRGKDPLNKAVNTFIRLGEPAYGISPGRGQLGYTIRSSSDAELNSAVTALEELASTAGHDFEGKVSWKRIEPFASVINKQGISASVAEAAKRIGLEVIEKGEPFPWSEDFGEFRRKCPITLFGLGSGVDHPPLHSESYDFNDRLIPAGVALFSELAHHFGRD